MKPSSQRTPRAWCAASLPLLLLLAAPVAARDAAAPRPGPADVLRPELRVDGEFSNARSVAVDSRGNMYVADADLQEIRVFSPTGSPLRRIGRRGAGPGEFQRLLAVAAGRGDTLYALDVGQQRVTAFTPDTSHRVAFTTRLPGVGAGRASYDLMVARGGRFVVQYSTPHSPRNRNPSRHISIRAVSREGRVLPQPSLRIPDREALSSRLPGNRVQVGPLPYGREPFLRLGPDDLLYYGWSGNPVVWILSLDGARVGSLRLPFAPGEVGEDEIDRLLESLDPKSVDYTVVSGAARQKRIPRTKPIFRDLLVDDRGRMWFNVVGRRDVLVSTERGWAYTSEDRPGAGASAWWVIGRDGRAAGKVPIPENVELLLVKGGKAYGIEVDEDGVQQLVRFPVRI